MLQQTYFVHDRGELEQAMSEVTEGEACRFARSVLVLLYANGTSKADMQGYLDVVKEIVPQASLAGISVISSHKNWKECGVSLSFLFFSGTEVEVHAYEADRNDEENIIADIDQCMNRLVGSKVALYYPVGAELDYTKIMEEVTDRHREVLLFGSLAGVRYHRADEGIFYNPDIINQEWEKKKSTDKENGQQADIFAIGNKIVESGCVFVTISGEILHHEAKVVLGWKPLGMELPVTSKSQSDDNGSTCVTEINNMPAAKIYKKYLDVDVDDQFLDNVCEFPIVIERNGMLLARVPTYAGKNGELIFACDIRDGEKLRLSYANPSELFRMSKRAAKEIAAFAPEGVLLTVCYNRYHYLRAQQYREIEYFMNNHKELLYGFGGAEICKYQDKGGIMNSVLIALGLKEGEEVHSQGKNSTLTVEEEICEERKDFAHRLLTFIDTSATELKRAYADAEEANQAKSVFLSNMSHEIRTPINAILGMNEMILRESKEPSIIEYANNIQSASNSLLGIVNDILDFSKISAGKMEIIPVEYEAASVLNDLILMIQKRASDKGLSIHINLDPDLPHILFGDEIRIKQVVTNILTNAVKYTEKGSITLNVDFEWCTADDSEVFDGSYCVYLRNHPRCAVNGNILVRVSVEDTGIGIRKEDLPKLFNSFERLEEKRNRTIEGTGLGMTITQYLLELMGSKLEVESEYGKGSKFSFALVQKIVDPTPIGDYRQALKRSLDTRKAYRESFVAPKARVLVVDDTEMNLTVIRNLLKKTQMQIDTANSGAECLQMIEKCPYHLIFLDHRMPEMDGMECLARIKAKETTINQDTPVIALTANAVSGSRELYLDAGFNNYLSKPIDATALEQMILNYLPEDIVSIREGAEEETKEQLPDWVRDLPFIDPDVGVKNCGDVHSYLQALKTYGDSFLSNREEIQNAQKEKRWADYTIKVHALKSSSRIIGAVSIGDLAESLEKAGNELDIKTIEEKTEKLLSFYSALGYMLYDQKKEASVEEEQKPWITEDKLNEAFMALRELAQMFDYDSVLTIMESLAGYRIPKDWTSSVEQLSKAVNRADWDEINHILEG